MPDLIRQAQDPLFWVVDNDFLNENGEPMEFRNYRFMIEPFMDLSPRQAAMKCSQIGWSVMEIFKDFWLARFAGANVIHTLPTKVVSKEFVVPKVDKIVSHNPAIREMVGETDSISLKSVGDRFVYYRGSFDEGQAISISAHVLNRDEYDRSNQAVLELYETRLGSAKKERPELGFVWDFSNPSVPNVGVHSLYLRSDQKVWMVLCPACGRWQEMRWPVSVDLDRKCYVCRYCAAELPNEARRMGKWVAQFPGRDISGYHVHKMMVPWVTAGEMVEASRGDIAIFHNFWLGLPYSNPDIQVGREQIVRAIVLTDNPKSEVVIGCDNGIEKHWVAGNRYGIFAYGKTKSWADIETLVNTYNAVCVIDANPYPTEPRRLVEKYRGRVFMHWFQQDTNRVGIVRWGEGDERGKVLVDRTGILDLLAEEIVSQRVVFNMPDAKLEPYIAHWEAVYRTVTTDEKGKTKSEWITKASLPDHWVFATELWRVGMEKVALSGITGPIKRRDKPKSPMGIKITQAGFGNELKSYSPAYDYKKKFDKELRRKRGGRRLFKSV